MKEFEFTCSSCGETHRGIPTFGWDYPIQVLDIPQEERGSRVDLGSDDCVIDNKWFYIRGCLEIPVHGYDDPFVWGAWVSLSENNFLEWVKLFGQETRSSFGPYFGWLAGDFRPYEQTCVNLKTRVHLRDHGIRPLLELEPTGHPLALEQRNGISPDRLKRIYEIMMHGAEAA